MYHMEDAGPVNGKRDAYRAAAATLNFRLFCHLFFSITTFTTT